ncbi:Ig-like domain-containing protein [Methanobrevibacter sp. UBA212]|uniref:Ig-like domain-containing protein n=1 Tax=Methanobrevibacter sp. UBA212 TaxID=1915476 RepID=UPI0025DC46E3|nr:hypothetical protein [Methanobrevibacter sp. UBA212]
MKIKQSLFLVFMVLISLCIISAASAADNASDVVAVTDDVTEVQSIDNVDEKLAVENDVVLEENADADNEPILAVDNSDKDTLSDSGFTFGGNGGNSSSKFDFSNITFDFGNGTKIDLGSLLNGTTISFGNGTSFNISDLLNSNMTFGNGTSFNLTQIMNMTGNGTGSFDISAIMDLIGGKKVTFEADDIKQTYSGPVNFKIKVLDGDKPVSQQTVVFTVNNKDYVGRTDKDGYATLSIDLAAGTHYVYTEYNNVIGKNKIEITKAASKLTAKKKTFKAKAKTKKYAITLKDNNGKAIKNAKVTLKVKGKTFTAKTNANGKATFKIKKLTKKGKYTAKVKFAGNGYYSASSASKKITIK